jgi:hypothetical protein
MVTLTYVVTNLLDNRSERLGSSPGGFVLYIYAAIWLSFIQGRIPNTTHIT